MIEVTCGTAQSDPRKPAMAGGGNPAVLVERAVTEHFEILNVPRLSRFGIIEAINHAYAFDRLLLYTIDLCRLGKVRCLENGGSYVSDMMKLGADSAGILNTIGPGNDERVACATKM